MKSLIALLAILTTLGWNTDNSNCKNSIYILDQVKQEYAADHDWDESVIKIHIQEPRIGNPQRFTKLWLDNSSDYFEMERNREDGIIKRIITENDESRFALNGEPNISSEIKEKYNLSLEKSKVYKSFYKVMYGLPMSINNELWSKIEPAEKISFKGKEAYSISIELKNELISKHWTIITSVHSRELLAVEFNYPDEPANEGEILIFEDKYEVNGIKTPRFRHWYNKSTNEYLGTDIIVKGLE